MPIEPKEEVVVEPDLRVPKEEVYIKEEVEEVEEGDTVDPSSSSVDPLLLREDESGARAAVETSPRR